ncbi:uncharacterized protein A4U43_C09F7470 [Asparagus officinalis]|uniref:Uncharacterized protein n=1 Tax=Asparagus officinalis TaxID=4686 RepID=A0A5P1E662_ASPOF|nr:uncharacterized protein A4U43_C09F7470 [Asparagus officinalis]
MRQLIKWNCLSKQVPQLDFTDINKENECPLPWEVPPKEDLPPTDITNIDIELEGPCPDEVPLPEADIFIEDEEVHLIIKMNKEKREPTGEVSSLVMELQTCIGTPHIVAGIDIEREVPQPLPGDVPPPEVDIFFKDEYVPLIIKLNKRKRDAKVPTPLKKSRAKRTMKPSKHIVTPYTEGKKKKEK